VGEHATSRTGGIMVTGGGCHLSCVPGDSAGM